MIRFLLVILMMKSSLGFAEHAVSSSELLNDETHFVSQPSECLKNRKAPCTLKSLKYQSLKLKDSEIVLLNRALLKVTDFENLKIEVLDQGIMVKQSKDSVEINSVKISGYPSYAIKTKDQVDVIDGNDCFLNEVTEDGVNHYLLDRSAFVKKIAVFYQNLNQFKADFKGISTVYNKSFKQDVVIQKKILTRRIASIQEEKDQEALRLKRIKAQQKLNREMLFKRTFAQ